jgi:hypothetical protein
MQFETLQICVSKSSEKGKLWNTISLIGILSNCGISKIMELSNFVKFYSCEKPELTFQNCEIEQSSELSKIAEFSLIRKTGKVPINEKVRKYEVFKIYKSGKNKEIVKKKPKS